MRVLGQSSRPFRRTSLRLALLCVAVGTALTPPASLGQETVRLQSSDPVAGAAGVRINTAITLTFDTPVSAAPTGTFLWQGTTPVAVQLTRVRPLGAADYATVWRIAPGAFLQYGTVYRVDLSTFHDQHGYPVAPASFEFTTEVVLKLVASDPPNGAVGVSVTPTTGLRFSTDVARSSSSVELSGGGEAVPVTLRQPVPSTAVSRPPMNALTVTPTRPLKGGTQYQVDSSGVTDALHRMQPPTTISFTTTGAPPAPLVRVTSTTPADGARNVPLDQQIEVSFSGAIRAAGLPPSILTLDGQSVSGRLSAPSATALRFEPAAPLQWRRSYEINVGTILDAQGSRLEGPKPFRFTTVAPAPLQVTSSNPVRGATNVPANVQVSVVFNQSVRRKAGAGDQMVRLADGGPWIPGRVVLQADKRTAMFIMEGQLPYLSRVVIDLSGWERDLVVSEPAEPPLEGIPFRTGGQGAQAVRLLEPVAGAALPTDEGPTFRWQVHWGAIGYVLAIVEAPPKPDALAAVGTPGGPSSENPAQDGFLDEGRRAVKRYGRYGVVRIEVTGRDNTLVQLSAEQWSKVKAAGKTLYWAVRARTAPGQKAGDILTTSEYRSFSLGAAPPGKMVVTLMVPRSGAVVNTLLPTFWWEVTGLRLPGTTYRIRVAPAQQGGGVRQPLYTAEVKTTSLTYDELAPGLTQGSTYAWSVQAISGRGEVLAASETRTFSVAASPAP